MKEILERIAKSLESIDAELKTRKGKYARDGFGIIWRKF